MTGYPNPPADFDTADGYSDAAIVVQRTRLIGDTYDRYRLLADGTQLGGSGLVPPVEGGGPLIIVPLAGDALVANLMPSNSFTTTTVNATESGGVASYRMLVDLRDYETWHASTVVSAVGSPAGRSTTFLAVIYSLNGTDWFYMSGAPIVLTSTVAPAGVNGMVLSAAGMISTSGPVAIPLLAQVPDVTLRAVYWDTSASSPPANLAVRNVTVYCKQ